MTQKRIHGKAGWWGAAVLAAGLAANVLAQDAMVRAGNLSLSPYLSLRGVYNSNLDATPDNELDDVSALFVAGLDFVNETRQCTISGSFWGQAEEYADYTDRGHQGFGNTLNIRLWERERLLVVLGQRYEDRASQDEITGSIEEWQQGDASVLLGKRMTDKLDGDLAYRYRFAWYDSERLYDWDQHAVDFTLGHDMTERTVGTLMLRAGRQTSDANEEDADYGVVHFGVRTRNSPKLDGAVGVGWHYHDVASSISTLSADGKLTWRPRDKITVDLSVARTVEPPRQDLENYNTATRSAIGLHYVPVREVTLSVIGMHARNDYDRQVVVDGESRKKRDDTWTGLLRCAYRPHRERFELFAEAKADTRDSTIDYFDYDRLVLSLGAKWQY